MNEKLSLDYLLAGLRGHGRCAFLLVQFLIELHNRLVRIYRDLRTLSSISDRPPEMAARSPQEQAGTQAVVMEVGEVEQADVTRAHAIVLGSTSAEEALILLALEHTNRDIDEMDNAGELLDFDAMQFDLGARWLLSKPFILEEVLLFLFISPFAIYLSICISHWFTNTS